MDKKSRVCIIGAESWGSAISTAVCKNALNGEFHKDVHIYVYDELVRSNNLSEVMNKLHENIKYLPGIKLDENLIAVTDLLEAAQKADILIFASTHSFIKPYCDVLAGKVKSSAYAVSMIKGLDPIGDGEIDLHSHAISDQLQIACYSLMSANSAMEMAQGKLSEFTIGCDNEEHAQQLTNLFQTDNCRVLCVNDMVGVEMCNTLKDLVALSAGFIDGLRLGENARVACLHLGLKEMIRFIKTVNPETKLSTFFESGCVVNSLASAYADKNVTLAKNFVTTGKNVQEIEAMLLNGRKLQGPVVAKQIYTFLERAELQDKFPLFTVLHKICEKEVPPEAIVDTLRMHPDLSNDHIIQLQNVDNNMPESFVDSVLENLDNTIPEHCQSSTGNTIDEHLAGASFDVFKEVEGSLKPYLSIPSSNNNLTELLENTKKSCVNVVPTFDAPRPNYENSEFSYDVGSSDIQPKQHSEVMELRKNLQLLDDVDKCKNEYLSIKSHPTETLQSGTKKLGKGKSPPTVGATICTEHHKRPKIKNYKPLRVKVKVNIDNQKDKVIKLPVKPTLSEKRNPSIKFRNANSNANAKSVNTDPQCEITKQKQRSQTEAKDQEQVLYHKDPMNSVRTIEEDPSVLKLIDKMLARSNDVSQKELKELSCKANLKLTKTNNQDTYKVDYLKAVRPKKGDSHFKVKNSASIGKYAKRDKKKSKSDLVPLQFSETNNSYRPTKTELISDEKSNQFDELEQKDNKLNSYNFREKEPEMDSFNNRVNKLSSDEEPHLKLRCINFDQGFSKLSQGYFDDLQKLQEKCNMIYEKESASLNALLACGSDSCQEKNPLLTSSKLEKGDNHSSDESIEGKSRVIEEQSVFALGKKEQVQHPENPNLRFYHGNNDGEITSEFKGLLNKKESNERRTIRNTDETLEIKDNNFIEKPSKKSKNMVQIEANDEEIMVIMEDIDEDLENTIQKPSKKQRAENQIGEDDPEIIALAKEINEDLEKNIQKPLKMSKLWKLSDQETMGMMEDLESLNKNPRSDRFEHKPIYDETEEHIKKRSKKSQLVKQTEPNDQEILAMSEEMDEDLENNPRSHNFKHKPHYDETNEYTQKPYNKFKLRKQTYLSDQEIVAMSEEMDEDLENNSRSHNSKSKPHYDEDNEYIQKPSKKFKLGKQSEPSEEEIIAMIDDIIESQDSRLESKPRSMLSQLDVKELDEELSRIIELNAEDKTEAIEEPLERPRLYQTVSELSPEEIDAIEAEKDFRAIFDTIDDKFIEEMEADNAKYIYSHEDKILNDKLYSLMAKGQSNEPAINSRRQSKKAQILPKLDSMEIKHPTHEIQKEEHKTKPATKPSRKRNALMRNGQIVERPVDYKGNNPYVKDIKILPILNLKPKGQKKVQDQGKMRKKVEFNSTFHPPLNPRVRIPSPPFDGRHHQYHTVSYCPPPDLLRLASLPLRRVPIAHQVMHATSNAVKSACPMVRLLLRLRLGR